MPTRSSSRSARRPRTSRRPSTTCASSARRKVGSIHLNVIRPFPEAAVIKALAGKKNVIILERTDEALAGDNPMGRDIRTALDKALQGEAGLPALSPEQMPRLFSGVYGLGSRDFRPEHTLGAYEFATGGRARKDGKRAADGVSFFVLGVDHPYEVKSDETPSLLPEGAIAVRFHSIGGWGAITTGKNLGAIIGDFNDFLYERDKVVDELRQSQGDHPRQRQPEVRIGKEGRADRLLHGRGAGAHPGELRSPARQRRAVLRSRRRSPTPTRSTGCPRAAASSGSRRRRASRPGSGCRCGRRQQIIEKKIRVFTLPGFVIARNATDRGRPAAAHAGQRVPGRVLRGVAAARTSSASARSSSGRSSTGSTSRNSAGSATRS